MNAISHRISVRDAAHWHGLRRECVVTASTVAALFDLHPYQTAFELYCRATEQMEDTTADNRAILCGHAAEAMCPLLAAADQPDLAPFVRNGDFFRHVTLPFGGTPDFFDVSGGCWQAKSVAPAIFAGQWQDGPPLWVLLQHQAEMLLTGAGSGGVICIVRDAYFTTHLYPVPPHAGTQARILSRVAAFAAAVAARTPPPVDIYKDAAFIITAFRYAEPAKEMDLTGHNRLPVVCAERLAAAADRKEAEQRYDAATAEILMILGDAARAITDGYQVAAPAVHITEKQIPAHVQPARDYRRISIKELTS